MSKTLIEIFCVKKTKSGQNCLKFFGGSTFVGGKKGGDLEFLRAQTRERGSPLSYCSCLITVFMT
jgi:hypothetical protein